MKTRLFSGMAAVMFCAAGMVHAGLETVKITMVRDVKDQTKERESGDATITTKEIVYRMDVLNKTFKPLANVEVKYRIFYEDPRPGATGEPVVAVHAGSQKFPEIEANRAVEFETNVLKLTTTSLDANVMWTSGASSRAKDRVVGVWVKVLSDGQVIGEYANPVTVTKKQVWKD